MAYIVKKPLHIRGRRFKPGDIVGDDIGINGVLIRTGRVAKVGEALPEAQEGLSEARVDETQMNLPVIGSDGSSFISVAPESICEAVRIVQLTKAEISAAIEKTEDTDTLIVLDLILSDKKLKAAVKERGLALQEDTEAGDA